MIDSPQEADEGTREIEHAARGDRIPAGSASSTPAPRPAALNEIDLTVAPGEDDRAGRPLGGG